jgi:hypothetical protein
LRHIVQTLPLWFPILLGFRGSEVAKWCALPCLVFWLCIMALIWTFLLGWTRILTGHYSPVEIIMTVIVGVAGVAGFVIACRWRTVMRPLRAAAIGALFLALQVAALRVSLLPSIAHR